MLVQTEQSSCATVLLIQPNRMLDAAIFVPDPGVHKTSNVVQIEFKYPRPVPPFASPIAPITISRMKTRLRSDEEQKTYPVCLLKHNTRSVSAFLLHHSFPWSTSK